jgi:glc operon protein GlcG
MRTIRALRRAAALAVVCAAPLSPRAAGAQLDAAAASKIVDGCVAHARGRSQSHAIAVYDDGGHPVALLRMDGNAPGITDFAMQKADAVAHWRFSTADMAEAARGTPGFANAPHVVTVAGGIPVYSSDGGRFLGAVGVSGEAPADDAACAEAGVKAAGLATTRRRSG